MPRDTCANQICTRTGTEILSARGTNRELLVCFFHDKWAKQQLLADHPAHAITRETVAERIRRTEPDLDEI